jgi:hypothetical protein
MFSGMAWFMDYEIAVVKLEAALVSEIRNSKDATGI